MSIVGNANPTRLCDPFETHCNIDPITKDIIVCDDNITDVNADAKFDPLVLRHIGILFCHAALDFVGTSHGVDHAGELNESAVPGILDDASVMFSDFGIEKRLSESFQLRQRAFFVDPYQAARARDIRRQNSRQSPLYVLAAQDAPPGSGKLNGYIAELWADVRLCPCPKRVIRIDLTVGRPLPVFSDSADILSRIIAGVSCNERRLVRDVKAVAVCKCNGNGTRRKEERS